MIKFSHTVFALPFALSAVVLATQQHYTIQTWDIVWIILAMFGARSAAMGFNRIVDSKFDAKNPRTAMRAIPSGEISRLQSIIFVIGFSFLFLFSSAILAMIFFYLLTIIIIGYLCDTTNQSLLASNVNTYWIVTSMGKKCFPMKRKTYIWLAV